jgi:acyl transferase domain-containing protein
MIWPREGLRRASVNSFGYGGANAHVIIDDAYHYLKSRRLVGKHMTVASPPKSLDAISSAQANNIQPSDSDRYRLFVWSAYDEGGLSRLSARYQEYLQNPSSDAEEYLDNFSYTLSSRRSNLPWKSFLVSKSASGLQASLAGGLLSKPIRSSASLDPTLAFVFTGQGAQWYAMGRELSRYSIFATSLRRAEKYLTFLGSDWKVTGKSPALSLYPRC